MAFVSVFDAMPEGAGWRLVNDFTMSTVEQFSIVGQNGRLVLNGTQLDVGGTITNASLVLNNWTQFTHIQLTADGMAVLRRRSR